MLLEDHLKNNCFHDMCALNEVKEMRGFYENSS